jgi:hypothetical protein
MEQGSWRLAGKKCSVRSLGIHDEPLVLGTGALGRSGTQDLTNVLAVCCRNSRGIASLSGDVDESR